MLAQGFREFFVPPYFHRHKWTNPKRPCNFIVRPVQLHLFCHNRECHTLTLLAVSNPTFSQLSYELLFPLDLDPEKKKLLNQVAHTQSFMHNLSNLLSKDSFVFTS